MNPFLENLFNKREKAISESSKNLYARNLTKLNGGEPVVDLKFLNDMKKVLLIIGGYKPTTKRSFIISACVVLKNNNEKLYQQYYELLSKMNTDLAVRTDKSETQKENWMDQTEIEKLLASLNVTKKVSNNDDYTKMLHHLILALYVLQIPRRNQDYCLMKIASDMTNADYNYLDLKNKKFIFNNYKTDGKYKSVEIDIEEEMFKVIQKYLKSHPDKLKLKNKKYNVHFLVDFFNRPIDKSNDITKILNKVFGKKIGSSMIRNIYLSSKYSKMMNELKVDTALMGTSTDVALNTYIKKD
jgi:septum formation topological specificity factor MinE